MADFLSQVKQAADVCVCNSPDGGVFYITGRWPKQIGATLTAGLAFKLRASCIIRSPQPDEVEFKMKPFAIAAFLMALTSSAIAVECAEGVRHAGCVGPKGAVEVSKPVVAEPKEVVVAPKKEVVVAPEKEVVTGPCRIVDGRRVCR